MDATDVPSLSSSKAIVDVRRRYDGGIIRIIIVTSSTVVRNKHMKNRIDAMIVLL